MEYVDGYTLERLLREQPDHRLEPRRALKIALGVAEALADAHRPPLREIHGDMKPANVLIRGVDEVVEVTNSGVAAALAERTGHTPADMLVYMAPEQAAGKEVDERADLYSLGAMLYEMLMGQRPPQLASSPPMPPGAAPGMETMPVALMLGVDRLVLGLLEGDPQRRYPRSAEEVVEELRALLEGQAGKGSFSDSFGSLAAVSLPPQTTRPPSVSYAPYPSYPSPQPVVVRLQQIYVPISIRPSSGKATAAMTLGIISYIFGGILTAIPAVILGHLALKDIRASNGQIDGHGQAVVGLVLGYISIGLTLLGLAPVLLLLNSF